MIWTKDSTRREFLDIVQAERPSIGHDLFSRSNIEATEELSPPTSEMQLIWRDDPRSRPELPVAIIVEADRQRDFLAWSLTFFPSYRPLTAYFRIVDFETAKRIGVSDKSPDLGRVGEACLGLILGETATYVDNQKDLRLLSAKACSGTCSYVVARSSAVASQGFELSKIIAGWLKARELTRQGALSLAPEAISAPWLALYQATEGELRISSRDSSLVDPAVVRAVRDLWSTGEVRNSTWSDVSKNFPGLGSAVEIMRGRREDRVIFLEEALLQVQAGNSPDNSTKSFLAGYLTSLVGPGTLDYVHLLHKHKSRFPGVLLWYGLCAGLPEGSKLSSFGNGLGRRTLRDLLRPEKFLDRPTTDIALSELQILASVEVQQFEFRTGSQNYLEVEVVPCASTTLKWSQRASPGPEFLSSSNAAEIEKLLANLASLAAEIDEVSERVAKATGVVVRQPELPQRRSRTRRR